MTVENQGYVTKIKADDGTKEVLKMDYTGIHPSISRRNAQWEQNKEYGKLSAALDMFFVRFPENPQAKVYYQCPRQSLCHPHRIQVGI